MNVAIVTTTINPPTKALLKYLEIAKRKGWRLYVVGDLKTPHEAYQALHIQNTGDHLTYLDPAQQQDISAELSEMIGWNCIQRRNFGFIQALMDGADIIATIDDDNVPYDNWGDELFIGQDTEAHCYTTDLPAFDPLAPHSGFFWHRGYPIELIPDRFTFDHSKETIKPLVQAGLWDGAPDIDAICRIADPNLLASFSSVPNFTSLQPMPFNSQNTFLSKEIFPTYFLFPHVGRMDDIWAAYHTQSVFGTGIVLFTKSTVNQERNPHNLYKDLEAEMLGYKNNLEIVKNGGAVMKYLPERSLEAYYVYQEVIKNL